MQGGNTEQDRRKKVLLLVGLVVLVILIITVLVVGTLYKTFAGNGDNGNPTVTIKKDPTTGQSFATQDGQAPESQVYDPTTPLYAGFEALLDDGMTANQVTALQNALQHYPPFTKNVQISLAGTDIRRNYPEQTDPLYRWSISSHIVVNQKDTYQIKVYYSGTNDIQLIIYDAAGHTQLFDSGIVSSS